MTKWTNEHVYYLSKNGASYVGTNPMKKGIQIDHHLLRNKSFQMQYLKQIHFIVLRLIVNKVWFVIE
ncbi:hypothetical protein ACFWM3_14660 [Gottfriedia sp. NPDC058432]|uniref:hypothetical protein n=1 Tax=Gottfriedia sp. NPDC058432 TaxID=3346497 RepID=UPI003656C581